MRHYRRSAFFGMGYSRLHFLKDSRDTGLAAQDFDLNTYSCYKRKQKSLKKLIFFGGLKQDSAMNIEGSMKIGELANKARCLAVTIRYYEKMGLLPNDKRDASNHRIYDEEDGERLRFILHCRNHKIPIQGIRKLLDMRDGGGKRDMEAARLLRSHIRDLKLQRESTDRLIESLTAILDGVDGNSANDEDVISAFGSICPHCPDFEEKMGQGRKMDERARFLASPHKR